ncbi:hypothetical protein UAY_00734 [Enterococcus moraviensis ATCC BAA-383]|uniref:Uncharacterized protein n=1 Tax=Enterococcus moraviensis ATCC BAA-383 TaxID=1158609 RepID=R2TDG0_9ENTE|nr:hypothetical protein [Enterococcus moraviensis]EOI02989.1 hypothetical protein UAY_00734 [Enterococcus moraviensis ATCC BAA-383]EOT74134.1 hypothetical protein I586_01132 [Enterococcus moraviensis ATCC BAA-383]
MKSKKLLFLFCIVILIVGIVVFIRMDDKKTTKNQDLETSSSQSSDNFDKSKVIDYSNETEVSFSYEEVTIPMEEIEKYREEIEKAGFDSTLFTDQEIQTMQAKIKKSGQTISQYINSLPDKVIDEKEIEKAREELRAANIDPDKIYNNELVDMIKQTKKENKSIVDIAKENKHEN